MNHLKNGSIIDETPDRSILRMSLSDWLKIPDNPNQATPATEKRLALTHWKRLNQLDGAARAHLAICTAACLDGKLFKVDGHARARLWQKGTLAAPSTITVVVHVCKTREELNTLYDIVHHGTRVHYEHVVAMYKELGIELTSNRLKYGLITEALNITLRGQFRAHQDKRRYREEVDLRRAIEIFRPELEIIDRIDPPPDVFYTGVLAAALILIGTDNDNQAYLEFFEKLARKQGNKQEGRMDPIETVLRSVEIVKTQKKGIGQAKMQPDLCARTIRAAENYAGGNQNPAYWMKYLPKGVELRPSIQQLKTVKKILRIKTL